MIKQAWKKITAVTCAVTMLVTGIGTIPKVQAEGTPANLTTLGWTDFGFTDDTTIKSGNDEASGWGVTSKPLVEGKSVLGSSFRGTVKFNKTEAQQYLQYGSVNNEGKGIRVIMRNTGTLDVYNMWADTTIVSMTPELAGIEEDTFNNVYFQLGLDFYKDGSLYKLKVYVNDKLYNETTYQVADVDESTIANALCFINSGATTLPDTIEVQMEREAAPENLTSITWADLGVSDDTIIKSGKDETANWGITNKNLVGNKTVMNSSFRGTIRFNKTSAVQYLQYGAWNGVDGKGLRIKLDDDGTLDVINMWTGESLGTINPEKAGLTEKTFNGVLFDLGLDLWQADDTYKLNVYINGKQYNIKAYVLENVENGGKAQFDEGVTLLNQGDANLQDIIEIQVEREKAPEGLTAVAWTDFGFIDDTVLRPGNDDATSWGITNKNLVTGKSIMNSSFRGTVKFNKTSATQYLQYGALGVSETKGIRIRLDGDILNVISMWTGASLGTVNPERAGLTEQTFNGTSFELGLDLWKADDTYKLNVYINGKQYNKAAYVLTNVEKDGKPQFDEAISFLNQGAATLKDVIEIILNQEEAPANLPQENWNSLRIPEDTYGYKDDRFAVLGHAFSTTIQNSSFRGVMKFTDENIALHYGDHWDGWQIGVKFALQSDGTIQVVNVSNNSKVLTTIKPSSIGKDTFKNQEFELGIDSWTEGNDIKFNIYINGIQYNHAAYRWEDGVASEHSKYTLTVGIITKNETPAIVVEYPAQSFVDIQKETAGYLPSGAQIRVNDKAFTGDALKTVGNYHVVVADANGVTATDVACYILGDANVDGEVTIRDIVAAKKGITTERFNSLASQKASDANEDGGYDNTDITYIRKKILGVETSTPNMAYSYTFRNDSNVMPIGGFVGPYDITKIDTDYEKVNLITDDIYKKIADCGITFITGSTHVQSWETSEIIIRQLKLTEKYGIDMFVNDATLYASSAPVTTEKMLAERIAKYSNFKSFKGFFLMDEPTLVGTYGNSKVQTGKIGDLAWDTTSKLSTLINSYSNLTSYMNLLPLRASMHIDKTQPETNAYKTYLEEYCKNYNPQFLSYDYYPWEWKTNVITGKGFTGDNATNMGGYFKNLAIVRDVANKYKIPFWTHVESGDGFGVNSGTDQNGNPTEGQFKWQINVELAFGAKGIQYFPLVQPNGYEVKADGTTDYNRNGLIGKDGNTNVWYNYAKEMNTQIGNMDHVLMNSVNKGLMVTGTYATSNMDYAKDTGMPILTNFVLDGNPTITAISTNETGSNTYGAIAGCFDYRGKSAVYVVNYNVTSAQNITVTWNQNHTYTKIDKNGSTNCGAATSSTLSLGAGEAALLVFE